MPVVSGLLRGAVCASYIFDRQIRGRSVVWIGVFVSVDSRLAWFWNRWWSGFGLARRREEWLQTTVREPIGFISRFCPTGRRRLRAVTVCFVPLWRHVCFCQDGVGSAAGRTVMTGRLDAVLPSLESLQCRIAGCRKLEAIPLTLLMYSTVIDQVSKFVISLFFSHL